MIGHRRGIRQAQAYPGPGFLACELGAVHILRQPPEGGEGVSQMLTIADKAPQHQTAIFGFRRQPFSVKGF